ncbi:MAG TPA: protein kinase [Polyangiaceae bacterium]|nr:protein kinase [Polyangiaceae bacterium]
MSDDAFDEVVRQAQTRVGRVLKDKWTLDQLLGVGGMASVYAATHRNQKRLAIKMLHPELSFNPAVRQRFLREGYVANSVQHSGAVSVFDDDVTDDGCAFLVMELLDGETLEGRWERKGKRLPPGEVLAFIDRVLETLAAAHARGIVHRDLKPENLFLTRDAQVKVLDFGIARVRELSGGSKTQTGSLMGTPTFMPPEQARGRWDEVDGQSDLWAVGATAFTLLSGQFVHIAGTVNEALVQAVTQPARSLGSVRSDLPQALVAFVDKSLAYEKAARFQDASAMQLALREAYAALASDWDEQTILAEAAAGLPATTLSSLQPGAGTTALVASASAPPSNARAPLRLVPIAAATSLLLAGVVAAFALRPEAGAPHGEETHAVSAPSLQAAAPSVAVASAAAAAPPTSIDQLPPRTLALEDLPAEKAKQPRPVASAEAIRPAPSVTKPRPTPPQTTVPSVAKPKPTAADPFAGRD